AIAILAVDAADRSHVVVSDELHMWRVVGHINTQLTVEDAAILELDSKLIDGILISRYCDGGGRVLAGHNDGGETQRLDQVFHLSRPSTDSDHGTSEIRE